MLFGEYVIIYFKQNTSFAWKILSRIHLNKSQYLYNIPSNWISKTIQHTPWHGARTYKVLRKYINAFSSYSAKTKRDGRTDRQTDGGRCYISRPGPPAPREIRRKLPNNSCSYKHHNVYFWLLWESLGGPRIIGTGSRFLDNYPLIHINQHVKYQSNMYL